MIKVMTFEVRGGCSYSGSETWKSNSIHWKKMAFVVLPLGEKQRT